MIDLKKIFARGSANGTNETVDETPFVEATNERIPAWRRYWFGRSIGVSIGIRYLRLATTAHRGRAREVIDVSRIQRPDSEDTGGQQAEWLGDTIARYVGEFGGRRPRVALVVSGPETTFRTFTMPALGSRQLASAIKFEVGKRIPFPVEECLYDYRRTGRTKGGGRQQYLMSLHASTQRFVGKQLESLEGRGIEVTSIYHTPDVMGDLLAGLADFDNEQHYVLVDVASGYTEISYYRGSSLEFIHTGNLGTAQLGDRPDVTRLEYFGESLARELQTSQDYYAGQFGDILPGHVYVHGDLARLPNVVTSLNEMTGVELELFPTRDSDLFGGSRQTNADLYPDCLSVVAASACRSSLASLLPAEMETVQSHKKQVRYARFSVAILLFAALSSWFLMGKSAANSRAEAERLEDEVARVSQSDVYGAYHAVKQKMIIDKAYLERARSNGSYFGLGLKELSLLTPESVYLSRLDFEPSEPEQNLMLYGEVVSAQIPPEIALADFVEKLSGSAFFSDVRVIRHAKRKTETAFVLEFQLGLRGIT